MKAIQVHQFIDDFSNLQGNDTLMSMTEKAEKPTPQKGQILVQVQACSISPADHIMVLGNLIFLHQPRPFIPGMDICGVVVDSNDSKLFQEGDVVVASNGVSPVGGMAEFMAVDENECVLKPVQVSVEQGAASSSAITAHNAVMDNIREGDRVLVIGGSGGVGSAAIQIAKTHAKASFVATTSTQTDLCKGLGADQVINYHEENWWEMDFDGLKFDVIIDTVGGGNFYGRAEKVLKTGKEGGKFVAVTSDDTKPDCRTVWKAIKFFLNMPWRPLYTSMRAGKYPKYIMIMPYDILQGRKQVLEWMDGGSLQVPIDDESPLPFTADGVRAAFAKVAGGHAHGKVVVSMVDSK